MGSPSSRGATPELLTPNTKLRRLLKNVDSSDDDAAQKSPTKIHDSRVGRSPSRQRSPDSSDSGSDSDIPVRPRGKLAARMQGAVSSPAVSSSAIPESSNTESARDRLRRQLLEDDKEEKNTEDAITNSKGAEPEDDEADDELPVARRRIRRRATPEVESEQGENTEALPARSPSPGLFVSSPVRPSPAKTADRDAGSDEELPLLKSDRMQALIRRKREEREAREAAEEAKQAERRAHQEKLASEMDDLDSGDDNLSSITDDEGGRQLSQKHKSTRKASKKAIEDINRETQRMKRNMQLHQEAKTRKKITKNSLFERFNFRPVGGPEPEPELQAASSSRPGTPTSDAEMKDADTAPSSPPTAKKAVPEGLQPTDSLAGNSVDNDDDELLPSVDELALETPKADKGKQKAVDVDAPEMVAAKPRRQFRVRMPVIQANVALDDSEDELQVTRTAKDKLHAVFDNVPLNRTKEPHSLQALRALAQVKSPGKETRRRKDQVARMTPAELEMSLVQRARQQARREREKRMDVLKAQGIEFRTVEDREREEQEVENILAKAREEAQRLGQEERAEAKRVAKENGTEDPLAWDDSDDESYEASANGEDEGDAEEREVELSGSEEEEEEEDGSEGEAEVNPMLIDEADENDASEGEDEEKIVETSPPEVVEAETDPVEGDEEALPTISRARRRNIAALLSDDEEDEVDVVEATPKPSKVTRTSPPVPATDSPAAPGSVLRSAKKSFIPGLPVEGPAGLGLTQIFAGTMDDSQPMMTPARGPTQSMMPDFDHLPTSSFTPMSASGDALKTSSQNDDVQGSTQAVKINLPASQMRKLDSLIGGAETQNSETLEMSQDGGFQAYTPLFDRFAEPPTSTVQTVVLNDKSSGDSQVQQPESPLMQRGRLRRKLDVIQEADKDAESAFSALRDGAEKERKRKEAAEAFDRKKSKAKEMVEEQADESEDEHQGLGGVDGEDSDDESTASVKDMIDDVTSTDADKAKTAAFYADRERAEDEMAVERLMKDVTEGRLRRKRGADYDLSDSDDGGEALRKRKQRQFAKAQKALFADEGLKKMNDDADKQAFLKTIQDQDSDDDMDLLAFAEPVATQESTSSAQELSNNNQTVPDSQPRKVLGSAEDNHRAPAALRRTKDGRKPANLGEIRETLTSLLEEPETSVIPATQAGSDSEGEQQEQGGSFRSNKENQSPNPRRGRVAIVDRISLKRNASSTLSNSRLAFAAGTSNAPSSSTSSFKVPAFLRRTSTAASFASTSSATISTTGVAVASTAGAGFGDDAKIKKTAGKKSGINSFGGKGREAGESEARMKLRETERKRQAKRVKGAERRMGVVGGLLTKGSFE